MYISKLDYSYIIRNMLISARYRDLCTFYITKCLRRYLKLSDFNFHRTYKTILLTNGTALGSKDHPDGNHD